MSFTFHHVGGSSDDFQGFAALLDELADATDEHPDVAVEHESGWALSVLLGGRVAWENVEEDPVRPRHLAGAPRELILELLERLSVGDIAFVEAHDWREGYP